MLRRSMGIAALALAAAPLLWAQAGAPAVNGEITKLDKPGGKVTIRHGEIKHLDMPPMTMVFRVREPKSLDGLAVGDRVRFNVEKIDGQYTVTAIGKAP